MKIKDLIQLNEAELKNFLREKKEELQSFYFKTAKGRVNNVKLAKNLRKDIARILTILKNTN